MTRIAGAIDLSSLVKCGLQAARGTLRGDRARAEDGFSLVELLVVIAMLVVVLGALAGPMLIATRAQSRDANFSFAQQEARTGLDSMVSQIRQATAILSSGPYEIEMNVNLGGVALHVEYECDIPQPNTPYTECVRVQAAQGSPLPPMSSGKIVLQHLLNGSAPVTPVFTVGPDPIAPYYMTATIKVPANDGVTNLGGLKHTIVFTDGALMRNLNVGN